MTKSEYRECLAQEVFKDNSRSFLRKIFFRLYYQYFWPSTRACYLIRKMQYLHGRSVLGRIRSKLIEKKLVKDYGIFISPVCEIGPGLHLPHPHGIVIGHASVIGRNVSIYQDVTIGGARIGDTKRGNQPHIADGCTIFTGAKVLGDLTLGARSMVAANAVLLSDTESDGVYAGIPAKLVKKNVPAQ